MINIIKKYKNMPVQLRAGFWFLVCSVLQRGITIITTPLFTRFLTPAEYGEYGLFISWQGIISCIVTLNLFYGTYMQAIVKFEEKKDAISSSVQGLTFTMTIFYVLIYFSFKNRIDILMSTNTLRMISMFIIVWSNAAFSFWSANKRVEYKYKLLVAVMLAQTILQPMLCILLLKRLNNKVDGVILGIAVISLVVYFIPFISQMIRGKVFYDRRTWTYFLKLGLPLIPHYLASIVLSNFDRIMIEKMVGKSQVGFYNLAYTISMVGLILNSAVLQTLQPWLYKQMKQKQYHRMEDVAFPSLLIIAIFNVFVLIFAPEILRIFAPSSFDEAKWVMPPIVASVFFMFMYNLFADFEFYYEKTHYTSITTVICALANILLNYIFIPIFGYIAAGYTTLVCYMMFSAGHYFLMQKINKDILGGIKIYNMKKIVLLSLTFISFCILIMITYTNVYVHYLTILILFAFIVIFRKKIYNYILNVKRKFTLENKGNKDNE